MNITIRILSLILIITFLTACTPAPTAAPTATATFQPTATTTLTPSPVPPTPTPTNEPAECWQNSSTWALVDVFEGDNYKALEPACAYEGLEKTVAWLIIYHNMGYTSEEAAEIVGIEPPQNLFIDYAVVPTNIKSPKSVDLNYWPVVPDFRNWLVDTTGNAWANDYYVLEGCFKDMENFDAQGNKQIIEYACGVTYYGNNSGSSRFIQYQDMQARLQITGDGYFRATKCYIGYRGNGVWDYLGCRSEEPLVVKDHPGIETAQESQELLYGLPLWNVSWVNTTFGVSIYTLPPSWSSVTDEQLSIINSQISMFWNESIPTPKP